MYCYTCAEGEDSDVYKIKLRLADVNILAEVIYESTVHFCRDYITDFDFPDISVSVTLSDIASERIKSDREAELEGTPKINPSSEYLETLALYRRIAESIIDCGVILFHGSAVAVDGAAYLFTAKSGTGKSTHTRLWREKFGTRAVMVNDDKPLIRITDDGAIVYGTPWNGKHRLSSNISVPLKAICILERDKENHIAECVPMAEFPKIMSQTYRKNSPEFMQKTLALLDKLLHSVKVYRLGCNMNPEAADVAYLGMKG